MKTKWSLTKNRLLQVLGFTILFFTLIGGTYVLFTTYTKQQHERSRTQYYDIVLLGDSLGEGVGATSPHNSLSEGIVSEVRQVHRDAQITNFATSGARLSQVIDLQLPLLSSVDADLVIIIVGANDAIWNTSDEAFRDSWNTIFERAAKENRHLIVLNVPKISAAPIIAEDIKAPLDARVRRFNTIINELATDQPRVHVFDFYAFSEAALLGRDNLLAEDRFHPNDRGQAKMAQAVGAFIRERKL